MSTVSTIQIWNMALGYVGTRTIASETENCEEARQCALYYDLARRQALRDYPYPWAQTRAALAAKAVPDVWAVEWRYAYGLPDLCLKLHRVDNPGGHHRTPFRIVSDPDGTVLVLTDVAGAYAEYTQDVQSPTAWDDGFAHMLARKLAALVAVPLLKGNGSKVSELEQLYRASIPSAYGMAASEGKDKPQEDAWITCRGA